MRLPVPNPKEVEAFQVLYAERFGVRLNPQDALEVSTRTLQLFYLKHYPCKPEVLRKSGLFSKPNTQRGHYP